MENGVFCYWVLEGCFDVELKECVVVVKVVIICVLEVY